MLLNHVLVPVTRSQGPGIWQRHNWLTQHKFKSKIKYYSGLFYFVNINVFILFSQVKTKIFFDL